jgi:hypothetical protein
MVDARQEFAMLSKLVPALTAAAALAAMPAQAEGWEFSLTPYFMAPNMDGKAAVGPADISVSASPMDIFRNLNWGAMGILEANNGKFGFAVDLTYMDLGAEGPGGRAEFDGHQGAYTPMVLMRIHKNAEAYVGARINSIGAGITATGPLGNTRSASRTETWVDPLIGVRTNFPLSRTIDLTVQADVGGFGIASDYAVQAWPALGFRLGNSSKAILGYRAIYVKYESGAGLDRFVYDVLTHGPTAGVQFRF